jgi:hypothetical protein
MGYIKEPVGVDFIVDPKPLTENERKRISEIIADYHANGSKMPTTKYSTQNLGKTKSKKKVS